MRAVKSSTSFCNCTPAFLALSTARLISSNAFCWLIAARLASSSAFFAATFVSLAIDAAVDLEVVATGTGIAAAFTIAIFSALAAV